MDDHEWTCMLQEGKGGFTIGWVSIGKLAMDSSFADLAKYHYDNFSQFLGQNVTSSAFNLHAKNKLAKLTAGQFSELSTDVNDEINRRKSKSSEYLPHMKDYPIKRNQAREKLSTLTDKRFNDLSADVLGELVRRFPGCMDKVQPMSAPNEIAKGAVTSFKDASLPKEVKKIDKPFSNAEERHSLERKKIKEYGLKLSEYQRQIADYEMKNLELEAKVHNKDYDKMKGKFEQMNESLRNLQISEESTKEAHKEMEWKYQSLLEQYQGLKEDYTNQEQMTLAIRVEANSLLEEVKNVTGEKEKLKTENMDLIQESKNQKAKIADLEAKYNKVLAKVMEYEGSSSTFQPETIENAIPIENEERKSLEALGDKAPETTQEKVASNSQEEQASIPLVKSASQNSSAQKQAEIKNENTEINNAQQNNSPPSMPRFFANSLISKERRFAYEEGLQELILNAEMQESTGILISMKEIVLACKGISQDITALEDKFPNVDIVDTKVKLSEALTKLMGSSKACATNFTPADLENLYSHASDLNKIVENLVNTFIAPSNNGIDDQEKTESSQIPPLNSFDYYDITDNDFSNADLKAFLEEQTDVIVHSIQNLLNAMRAPGPYGEDFTRIIHGILDVVDAVIENCRSTMLDANSNPQLLEIFDDLFNVSRQLETFGTEIVGPSGQSNKQLKQKMASSSYEIAKYVKELLTFLES